MIKHFILRVLFLHFRRQGGKLYERCFLHFPRQRVKLYERYFFTFSPAAGEIVWTMFFYVFPGGGWNCMSDVFYIFPDSGWNCMSDVFLRFPRRVVKLYERCFFTDDNIFIRNAILTIFPSYRRGLSNTALAFPSIGGWEVTRHSLFPSYRQGLSNATLSFFPLSAGGTDGFMSSVAMGR